MKNHQFPAILGEKVDHKCIDMSDVNGRIVKINGVWYIQVEEYGDYEPIKYCPYCAENLYKKSKCRVGDS